MGAVLMTLNELRYGMLKWFLLAALVAVFVLPLLGFSKDEEGYTILGFRETHLSVRTSDGLISGLNLGTLYPCVCVSIGCSFMVLVLVSWISARVFMTLLTPGSAEFFLTRGTGRLTLMGWRFAVVLLCGCFYVFLLGLVAVCGTGISLNEVSFAFLKSVFLCFFIYLSVMGATLLIAVISRRTGLSVGLGAALILASIIFDTAYQAMQHGFLRGQRESLAYKVMAAVHAILPNVTTLSNAAISCCGGTRLPWYEIGTTAAFGAATVAAALAIFRFRDL
ncbi:MAG: hypothetical protein DRP82_07195 [Planctomycetota bacterium]|nr:MAG: hypothetical protein DRP82_07195 [Planctomycetota bacterium]